MVLEVVLERTSEYIPRFADVVSGLCLFRRDTGDVPQWKFPQKEQVLSLKMLTLQEKVAALFGVAS